MTEINLWELSQPERRVLLDESMALGPAHAKALYEQLVRQAGGVTEFNRRTAAGE